MKFAILTALASVALANSAHAIDYVTLSNNQTIVLQPNTTTEVKCGTNLPAPTKVCGLFWTDATLGYLDYYEISYVDTSLAAKTSSTIKRYNYGSVSGYTGEFSDQAAARAAAVAAGKSLERSGFCAFVE